MMNSESVPRSILSNPFAVDLIQFIAEKGELMASQTRLVSSNYMKMVQLARKLESAGLITIEEERKPRVMYTYRLTPKGKRVAEKLTEIEEIIE